MKILILGGTGMLGHRLWIELAKNYEVAATVRGVSPFPELTSYNIPDISNYERLEEIILNFKPNVVINCIGLIKQAEDHDNALINIELNAALPNKVAQICKKIDARLILFSTDCVFSGKKGNYSEADFADADDVYGRSKRLGEIAGSQKVLTLRTSIIGRELRGKASLVEWFLSQKGKVVNGYPNAIFSGFPTKTIAEILDRYVLNNQSLHGVYHLSSAPISKYELLNLIKDEALLDITIHSDANFRIDRSLNSITFREATQFSPQDWKQLVKDIFVNDIEY
jgi:dTDP-4-dehydrorhamnose reductase